MYFCFIFLLGKTFFNQQFAGNIFKQLRKELGGFEIENVWNIDS